MHDLFHAILLGIIEGITEFLPISSTGHLLVAERWLGSRSDLFNIVIQAGAILAIVAIYRTRLDQLVLGWRWPENRGYALKLGAAFAITALGGFIVTRLGFQLPERIEPVAWALLIGGFWMLAAVFLADRSGRDSSEFTWTVAVLVGLAQIAAAVFPGTSRSAATIFIAMLAGTRNRSAATEFAFLVGIPTMLAASGYELLRHFGEDAAPEDWAALAAAFASSTITAFVAVKWLLGYIRDHRFTAFAIYRIVLGAALLLFAADGA
jgi:undecaprenyl-diphosphatase